MLKNKFKLIVVLAIIILTLTLPVVRAENETVENAINETTIPNEDPQNPNNAMTADTMTDATFKRGDVYLTGDNVTVDYIVDGNLFVLANNVTINSQIGGDAFICANTVTIEESGYVFSNLFTVSESVVVNGVVYDLYACTENTTINGYVYRDIRIGSNTVNIFGTVGRNAYLACANLNFKGNNNEKVSQGVINGNLKYLANQEFSIPEGCVTGETSFEQQKSNNENTLQDRIGSLITFIITTVVIWLLCLWLAPKFLENVASLISTKKVLPVIGFGILVPIVSLILAIGLLVLGITSILGILLLVTLFVLMAISTPVFVIAINNLICDKLKLQKKLYILGMLIVISTILWLIDLIPYVGSIIGIISIILGFGTIISSLVSKTKTKDINESKK